MPIFRRLNVLTVLLEYNDLSEWQHKDIWDGYPALYYTLLVHFILSLAIVANYKSILLGFATIMPAFCSLCFCLSIFLSTTQTYIAIATCDMCSKNSTSFSTPWWRKLNSLNHKCQQDWSLHPFSMPVNYIGKMKWFINACCRYWCHFTIMYDYIITLLKLYS